MGKLFKEGAKGKEKKKKLRRDKKKY